MSQITLYGEKPVHDVPELLLVVFDLKTINYVYKDQTDDMHTFLPCVEYENKQYTPREFFHLLNLNPN